MKSEIFFDLFSSGTFLIKAAIFPAIHWENWGNFQALAAIVHNTLFVSPN